MFNFLKKKEELDLVGIGDITVDTFIELIDAWIETDNPEKKRELCMTFGDKIPYSKEVSVLGTGNSINAVHAAQKLGLKTGVITNLGNDEIGERCIENLKEAGISTKNIKTHADKTTNHNFILRFKEERTILVHHNEYDYVFPSDFKAPKWLYLSSLANNSIEYHAEIVKFLIANPKTKLAFQPGTFQIKLGKERLTDLYAHTEIFFCNKEEAQKILSSTENEISKLLEMMHALGPKIVVITDGPLGAYVFDGATKWHGSMYPDIAPPVDRTGAGDAFAGAFTSAIILGRSIETALMWAPINSMSVVQYIGAQEGHLNQKQIEAFLAEAPDNYRPQIIN